MNYLHLSYYSYPNERFVDYKLNINSMIRATILLKTRVRREGGYVHIVFWSCTLYCLCGCRLWPWVFNKNSTSVHDEVTLDIASCLKQLKNWIVYEITVLALDTHSTRQWSLRERRKRRWALQLCKLYLWKRVSNCSLGREIPNTLV